MDLIDFDFYGKLEYNRSSNDYKFSEMTSLQDVEDRDPDDYQLLGLSCILYGTKKLPELKFEDIGTGRKYRGDTLNTYRSLFGRDLSVQKKYGFDDRLTKKVKTFRKKYLTIGNLFFFQINQLNLLH